MENKLIKAIYLQYRRVDDDVDDLITDFRGIFEELQKSWMYSFLNNNVEEERTDEFLNAYHTQLCQYRDNKNRFFQSFSIKPELERHKMAVFLNVECGKIYDIALIVRSAESSSRKSQGVNKSIRTTRSSLAALSRCSATLKCPTYFEILCSRLPCNSPLSSNSCPCVRPCF